MAGERIAIYETENKIIEGDYGDFYNTISRTEAIERMAKAMWNRNQKQIERTNKEFVITLWETIERPSPNTQFFLEEAEAALNALLEVNRNE